MRAKVTHIGQDIGDGSFFTFTVANEQEARLAGETVAFAYDTLASFLGDQCILCGKTLIERMDNPKPDPGFVYNLEGVEIAFDAAVKHMDADIANYLHSMGFDDPQAFMDAYEIEHQRVKGERWSLSGENPVW